MFRYTPDAWIRQGKTIITAHSGCENTPDNSIEHIRAAIASGADMIEVDLRMTDGGVLYLSHDVPEDIAERPLLTDLLDIMAEADHMGINLDAKTEGLIEPAMAIVREYGLSDRVIFTGSVARDRALAVSLGTDVWHNLEKDETVQDGLDWILQDGCPCLNVRHRLVTEELVQTLRSRGRGFSVWTVNEEEDMRRCLSMGVCNLTTRRPSLAVQIRQELAGQA